MQGAAVLIMMLVMTISPALAVTPELIDVYPSGVDGYHTYRIPTIIVTRGGAVLALAEGRRNGRGDSGDIDMLVKRSVDGGRTWSATSVVWDDGGNTCGNPCLVTLPDGRIGCFFERDDYAAMTLAVFDVDWLTDGSEP